MTADRAPRTRLYGLTIASEIPLHQERAVPDGSQTDLDIRLGDRRPSSTEVPTGRVLLDFQVDRQMYTGCATDDGYLLRFYGTCDVAISADLRRATVHPVTDPDEALLSVIVGGTVLAFVLALRGEAVLHASAVQVGERALGFVGASGMGKSTSATLLCAAGARLITDDLLRLDLATSPPRCSLGATEVRLRNAADELADRFDRRPARRTTGDERDALGTALAELEGLPLAALVIPAPQPLSEEVGSDLTRATFQRVAPKEAFFLLCRFPRLLGWRDERVLARQFDQLADLVERVPVHVAQLPWGPPFPDGLSDEILGAVGLRAPALTGP